MKSIYHAGYQIASSHGHPFPMSKYGLLKELLLADGVIGPADIIEPDPIDLKSAALAHTRDYLEKLESQSLSATERAAIIDLDVHQGNGSAAIFGEIEEVFTFSMHGERNFPSVKMRSDLDLALRYGTGDREYLDLLERSEPDIAFYVAGVDVAADDRYGRLSLTEEGIRLRDRAVIETVRGRGIPLGIVLAGGYAATGARTAELHTHVFREAAAYERRRSEARIRCTAAASRRIGPAANRSSDRTRG